MSFSVTFLHFWGQDIRPFLLGSEESVWSLSSVSITYGWLLILMVCNSIPLVAYCIMLLIFTGVLVLLPNYPLLNILLTSFIFVCCAHEIHIITNLLIRFFVPDDNVKIVLRNMVLFIMIMIPIGIADGMFWNPNFHDKYTMQDQTFLFKWTFKGRYFPWSWYRKIYDSKVF